MTARTILVGDLGGTKTDLAIFSSEAGPKMPLAEASFHSVDYRNLETIIGEFLSLVDYDISQAYFGVAGPVVAGRASLTNLGWVIGERQLETACNFSSVHLMNDLVATAYSLPFLEPVDLHLINRGRVVSSGAVAVIAPGTGLGEAFLTWDGKRFIAHPSEGGHADFAPNNNSEIDMLVFLRKRFDHVSYENLCSGRGLPNIYSYFRQIGYEVEPDWLSEELALADDPTPVIINGAFNPEKSCALCRITLSTFISILGAEAGNLALKVLATGGVYLGGGIPPRILSAFSDGTFMQSFSCKGRMSGVLKNMPVHVITNPKAALLGAAVYGLQSKFLTG